MQTCIPMGTNSAPLLADLFLHTYEYEFIIKTMKGDITRALQFNKTFRYIDDLFCVNNRCLSLKLQQQGYKYQQLMKSFHKFYRSHSDKLKKFGTALMELRSSI